MAAKVMAQDALTTPSSGSRPLPTPSRRRNGPPHLCRRRCRGPRGPPPGGAASGAAPRHAGVVGLDGEHAEVRLPRRGLLLGGRAGLGRRLHRAVLQRHALGDLRAVPAVHGQAGQRRRRRVVGGVQARQWHLRGAAPDRRRRDLCQWHHSGSRDDRHADDQHEREGGDDERCRARCLALRGLGADGLVPRPGCEVSIAHRRRVGLAPARAQLDSERPVGQASSSSMREWRSAPPQFSEAAR
mmetsp:Transcript_77863/g.218196  ORF Transcript_77863/g.218196 Transcript_77863/m.218196 type:complete len:242 (+) Transcript_77863:2-727(+)